MVWSEVGGNMPAVLGGVGGGYCLQSFSHIHSSQSLLEAVPERKTLNESPAPQMHERLFPPASIYTILYADRRTVERAVL